MSSTTFILGFSEGFSPTLPPGVYPGGSRELTSSKVIFVSKLSKPFDFSELV